MIVRALHEFISIQKYSFKKTTNTIFKQRPKKINKNYRKVRYYPQQYQNNQEMKSNDMNWQQRELNLVIPHH